MGESYATMQQGNAGRTARAEPTSGGKSGCCEYTGRAAANRGHGSEEERRRYGEQTKQQATLLSSAAEFR
jgi:hypothetical protein